MQVFSVKIRFFHLVSKNDREGRNKWKKPVTKVGKCLAKFTFSTNSDVHSLWNLASVEVKVQANLVYYNKNDFDLMMMNALWSSLS